MGAADVLVLAGGVVVFVAIVILGGRWLSRGLSSSELRDGRRQSFDQHLKDGGGEGFGPGQSG